ncbi:MAG: ABC transporter substrate-binding protein [Reichenbachiella sp.]
MINRALYFHLVVFICSCSQHKKTINSDNSNILTFSEQIVIEEYGAYHLVKLKDQNAWTEFVLYNTSIPDHIDQNNSLVKIKVPVESIVSNSTTHLSFLEALGSMKILKGFAQTNFISSQLIIERVENGDIIEIGNNTQLNVEEIININPQLVLTSGMQGKNGLKTQLNSMGINIMGIADFSENSLLGKTEWIKFFGYLVGKEERAIDIFNEKVFAYDSLKKLVEPNLLPKVMSGSLYGGNWFLPGGENYNATLIAESGGFYLWSDDKESGWLNLDFEVVYEKAHDADVWIGAASFSSLKEMNDVDERYSNFKAFKQSEIYTYTGRVNKAGANDYFESGNMNPDRILADHIKILHPEILPNYELYYYTKLE